MSAEQDNENSIRLKPTSPEVKRPADRGTIRWYAEEFYQWMLSMNFSRDTVKTRRTYFKKFLIWCEERGIQKPGEVTQPLIERFQKQLYQYRDPETGAAVSTHSQRASVVAVRCFFAWMRKRGHLKHNPAHDVELPRAEHRLPVNGLTLEEVEKVLSQPNIEDPFGIRDRAMLEVLYSTGVRRSELCNVQLYDVDATKGTLVVRQGKGKQDRVVPIGARALVWVDKYITEARPAIVADPDHGYLFVAPRGGKLRVRVLGETVHAYIKKSGVKKKGSCHLFRHAMATLMLENGAEIRALQQMLGHKQIVSTQRYTNVTIMKLKEIHAATHPADNPTKDEMNSELQENPAAKKLRAIPGGRF